MVLIGAHPIDCVKQYSTEYGLLKPLRRRRKDYMEKKLCHKCGEYKLKNSEFWHRDGARPDGLDTKCKVCKSKYQKSFKAKMSQKRKDAKYYAKNSNKSKAREESRRKFGSAMKTMCAFYTCGSMANEWHHIDYNFPLEVIPLCNKHHRMIHN